MPNKKRKKDAFDFINPFTKKYVKPLTDWCFQSRTRIALIVFAVVLVIIFASYVKQVLLLTFLIMLGGISRIYQRYFRVQVGIEFIMLVTVVAGFAYGSFIGAFVGALSLGLSTFFSGRASHKLFVSFWLIILVGLISPLLKAIGIVFAGIILTFFYDLILFPLHLSLFQTKIPRITLFIITHFFWNLWVFTAISPQFLALFT